jgi:cytochrome c
MVNQPKYLPYAENDFFDDGRSMRLPPFGTVSRENLAEMEAVPEGRINDVYVEKMPGPLTLATLQLGRKQFEIVCAACHGLLGDGNSVVSEKMALAPPPSLHAFTDRPDGFFYEVIAEGYGLMPSYAAQISRSERWAIVAYVRALQKSQNAKLEEAPAEVQARLLKEAR